MPSREVGGAALHERLSTSPSGRSGSPRRSLLFCGGGGCPAANQAERLGGSGAGVGGLGEYRQARVEDDFEALVVELEAADLDVVEALDAADVEAHVVAGPVLAELLAAGRQ